MILDTKAITDRIHSCEQWGARSPRSETWATTPRDAVVHHMDWPNRPLISDPVEAVQHAYELARRCQADHMDGNGWADTGQHFTITREGIILEGRHGSLRALLNGHCVHGAHAADPGTGADDNSSWGVEHEGTYSVDEMPAEQWNASVWLFAVLCIQSKLDTATVKGHRDTGCQTACPGDWLHEQLPRFRQECHAKKLELMAS